jgi:hypothetical protein
MYLGFLAMYRGMKSIKPYNSKILFPAHSSKCTCWCQSRVVAAHAAVGRTLFFLGMVASAHTHFTQGVAFYDPTQHRASVFRHGEDSGVICYIFAAWTLWYLGYPAQGLARSQEAVTLAQQLAHPYNLSRSISRSL